ncbi:mannose-6-phosphate isomerase, class I [Halobacillus sp. BAB-2008]|uniref:mannose-6-phosphate isomerase, class I n=1 Tax=Halobacillus sp. BAB-2008 TaxID=1246484 RepID=UPI003217017E
MFDYDIPSNQTGEAWCISGHANGSSTIKNGPLQGKTLAYAWEHHRELFSNEEGNEFPLLTKLLDSKKDLSVQVHPNDSFAREVEGENYGKTECWYVVDCEEDAEIIFGHHAADKEELIHMVNSGDWDNLLRKIKVTPGDFFYVPSGTIHAIGAGIQILETQQSSDITYRVYDYDRVDAEGQQRELHLEKSLDVTNAPHHDPAFTKSRKTKEGLVEETLIEEDYFSVYKWQVTDRSEELSPSTYLLVSTIEGEGKLTIEDQSYSFKKGDHFILPSTIHSYTLHGNATFIVSKSNQN